jgi:type IV pilus assembly protein PilA
VRKDAGFTVVESLVVIGIIGLLIAVAVPNLASIQERARRTAVRGVMQSLNTAIQAYAADNNGVLPGIGSFKGWSSGHPDLPGMDISYWFPGGDPIGIQGKPARGRMPLNPYSMRSYNSEDKDLDGETYFGILQAAGQNERCLLTDPGCPYADLPAPASLQGTICIVSSVSAMNVEAMGEYGIIGYGRDVTRPISDFAGEDVRFLVVTN